jgi:hypothetical protein
MGLWVAIVAGVFVLGGLIALKRSLRARRLDDHPVCRRCRFDLHGVYPESTTCPECAADLTNARAIHAGNRRVSWPKLVASSVVILLSVIVIAYVAANRIDAKLIASFKPAWLLEIETGSVTGSTAAIAIDELARRIGDGELSDERTIRLVDAALRRQAEHSDVQWLPSWADLIEVAWSADAIGRERYGLYKRQAVEFMTGNPYIPKSFDRNMIPIAADITRASAASPFSYKVTPTRVSVDGVVYGVERAALRGQVVGGSGMMVMGRPVDLSALPGGTMAVVWEISILDADEPLVTYEETLEYELPPP